MSFFRERRIRSFIHSETSESSHATDFVPITTTFGGNVLKVSEGPRTAIIRSIGSVALPLVIPQPKQMPWFDSVHTWKELPPCSGQYHLWASFCEGLDPNDSSKVSIRTCRAFMMRLLSRDVFIWGHKINPGSWIFSGGVQPLSDNFLQN